MIAGVFVYLYINFVTSTPMGVDLTQLETPIGPSLIMVGFGFFYASVCYNIASFNKD